MAQHREGQIVLMDTRPADVFESCHIPDSINVPLYGIRTRSFLKKKSIVLVGNGFSLGAAVSMGEELNKAGYSASVLAGGLLAWQERGGRLAGDPFACHGLAVVSPDLFAESLGREQPLMIYVKEEEGERVPSSFFHGLLNLSSISSDGGQALRDVLGLRDNFFLRPLVLITGDGRDNAVLQRRVSAEGIRQVYFLAGGWKGYEEYRRKQQAGMGPVEKRSVGDYGCSPTVHQY
nr:rhodanese-like domain-containing protein [Desulfobotulus pelophilus]